MQEFIIWILFLCSLYFLSRPSQPPVCHPAYEQIRDLQAANSRLMRNHLLLIEYCRRPFYGDVSDTGLTSEEFTHVQPL